MRQPGKTLCEDGGKAESSARLRWLRDGSSVVDCRVGPLPPRLSPTMATTIVTGWGPQGEPTTGRKIFPIDRSDLWNALSGSGDVRWLVEHTHAASDCRMDGRVFVAGRGLVGALRQRLPQVDLPGLGRVIGCNLFGCLLDEELSGLEEEENQ